VYECILSNWRTCDCCCTINLINHFQSSVFAGLLLLQRAPNKILVENPLASTFFVFLHFQPIACSFIDREQHEKHLYNQTSHYGKYGMHDRQSACPGYLYEKWVYHLNIVYHYASFCFQLFERLANIPSKE